MFEKIAASIYVLSILGIMGCFFWGVGSALMNGLRYSSFFTCMTAVAIFFVIAFLSSQALSQDEPAPPVAGLVNRLAKQDSLVPDKYMLAKGQCLEDRTYPELANEMHDVDNWPYGRCDATHFRLPKLDCMVNNVQCETLIRVRP